MRRARVSLLAPLVFLSLTIAACDSSPSVTCTNGTIVAAEANDYAFASSIALPPVSVMPMSNLTFDWSGVTADFLTQPVNPQTDLNTIFLLLVNLPAASFEMQLNNDTFAIRSVVITPPPQFNPTGGVTSASLYTDFSAGGETIDATAAAPYLDPTKYTPPNSTFAIVAQTGAASLGTNIRMMQSFQLDPTSTNTTVKLTNSSTTLKYTADLHSLHPTGVPAKTAALTLDWSQITTNALGQPFVSASIATAIVGHYTQTRAELESRFLDLQTIPGSTLYTASIPFGMTLDFTTLMDSQGNPFPGIDSTGTWLVALLCTNCRNPAPWYLTILEPATQPCK
jgi:hypothetical protein